MSKVFIQTVDKGGAVHTQLDDPRSMKSELKSDVVADVFSLSGKICDVASGKKVYIKQIIITEKSGDTTGLNLEATDLSAERAFITPKYIVEQNFISGSRTKIINTLVGPTEMMSGQYISVGSGSDLHGDVQIVTQIDPGLRE